MVSLINRITSSSKKQLDKIRRLRVFKGAKYPKSRETRTQIGEEVISLFEPLLWLKFDEGTGTTVVNYGSAGSGSNGSFGGLQPTWGSGYATFDDNPDGTNDGQHIDVAAFGNYEGFDIIFRNHDAANAALTAQFLYADANVSGLVLGASTAALTDEIITVQQTVAGGYDAEHKRAWTDNSDEVTANVWHCLQVDSRV
jgi:hypothetical protein